MAKGIKTGGRDFPPGHKFGKGRPKVPEDIKQAREMNRDDVTRLINSMMRMSPVDLKTRITDPGCPLIEVMIGSIVSKAVSGGDHQRANFLLDRLIGKVKDEVDLNVLPRPTIVKRKDGTEIVMGATRATKDEE